MSFAFFQPDPNPKIHRMSISLQTGLRQTTTISPQVQQSLQLLQTPALELQNLLQSELQTNPVLEEEPIPAELAETPEAEDPEASDADADWPVASVRPDRPKLDPKQAILESTVRPESLSEHLESQLALAAVSRELRTAASEIIGNLDEDGFLRTELAEIAAAAKTSTETATQALALVQSFHPPGVAARTLPEIVAAPPQTRAKPSGSPRSWTSRYSSSSARVFASCSGLAAQAPICPTNACIFSPTHGGTTAQPTRRPVAAQHLLIASTNTVYRAISGTSDTGFTWLYPPKVSRVRTSSRPPPNG